MYVKDGQNMFQADLWDPGGTSLPSSSPVGPKSERTTELARQLTVMPKSPMPATVADKSENTPASCFCKNRVTCDVCFEDGFLRCLRNISGFCDVDKQ